MPYWQHNRSMSPRQLELAINKLGMSKAGAGRYLGISERRLHRMCAGQAIIPANVVLLLCSLIEHGEPPLVPTRRKAKP